MVHRIEVGFREGIRDALGEKTKRKIVEHLGIEVADVRTVEVYTIEGDLSPEELAAIAGGPFSDPVIQYFTIDKPAARSFDWLIEVGFRPGVTDNVGKTAAEAVRLLLGQGRDAGVFTSRQYCLTGRLDGAHVERIASGLLANDLIQRYEIIHARDWDPKCGNGPFARESRLSGLRA